MIKSSIHSASFYSLLHRIIGHINYFHPSQTKYALYTFREEALHHSRTYPPCVLKTPFLPHDKALLVPCLQVFDSLVVVGLVSTEIFVLNKARWMFHLSQSFTNEQKPFCIRLGSWGIISLTDFHKGTEAFLRTGRTRREERPLPRSLPRREGA